MNVQHRHQSQLLWNFQFNVITQSDQHMLVFKITLFHAKLTNAQGCIFFSPRRGAQSEQIKDHRKEEKKRRKKVRQLTLPNFGSMFSPHASHADAYHGLEESFVRVIVTPVAVFGLVGFEPQW